MLTPEAKNLLSSTIRNLRERLITDLYNAVDSAYRLSISATQAKLPEEQRIKRKRLENWLKEQNQGEGKGKKAAEKQQQELHLQTAVKLAAATFINRLVVIKQMEAQGLIKPAVITGGWQSPGYREFRDFAPELLKDESEGYSILLKLLFDELAIDLPGLFGNVGITALFPIPTVTLRAVIEALDNPNLKSAWLDDTTLGWVYQYWNDPEREALDAKLNGGGKVEPHEIASKTQMFTERYMVEWLLQNSLGQMWLAICKKQGWIPAVEADGTLDNLAVRRKEWREKRERGEVALDELMPVETANEQLWKYWVEQPLTDEAVLNAPASIREIKILDPACGSGHFLVIALDLLLALYQEEAQHRGESWSNQEIVKSILENNLYGIDIDARAVQIAAASLVLKAQLLCSKIELGKVNLVASNLQLGSLAENDPAWLELRREVKDATGISEKLTDKIIETLKGADHLGSLLKIGNKIDEAIGEYIEENLTPIQGDLFTGFGQEIREYDIEDARKTLLEKLENFLSRYTSSDNLGLRLRGEQLAVGVRFIRMVREDYYDLVIGNPPYQGTSKMVDAKYITKEYPKGKADLYAAFLERGLQLVKYGGISALLTMRNWMFIQQFTQIREWLLNNFDLRILGDFDRGAFDEVPNEVLAVTMSVFQKLPPVQNFSIALQPTALDDNSYDRQRTNRKRAAVLAQVGLYGFLTNRFNFIKEKPLIYWWDDDFLQRYAETPKLGDETEVRQGMATSNNTRFLRLPWEVQLNDLLICPTDEPLYGLPENKWVPYIKGAEGKAWFEPLTDILLWKLNAIEIKLFERDGKQASRPQNENFYFFHGIAFPSIGSKFTARSYRYRSVFGNAGLSVFPKNIANTTCLMNSQIAQKIVASLNPTVNFLVGDVKRLPLFPIESAEEIFNELENAFTEHENASETSVEFKQPAPSAWNYAQEWAQTCVDREPGTPLPPYQPVYEQPPATNHVSFAVGVALGRFPQPTPETETPNTATPTPETTKNFPIPNPQLALSEAEVSPIPQGILYLSTYNEKDSLQHPACQLLQQTYEKYSDTIAKNKTLSEWLRLSFFKEVHLGMYENRPIYFPLSSSKKNFVAFISIHRWTDTTLQTLLADYLIPELSYIDGEINDLMETRNQGDKKKQTKAEERYNKLQQQQTELKNFIDLVRTCAEQGPPPANPKDTPREVNHRLIMNLDDGVMINSACLWPLLEPQWTQPKKWWSELCNAQGKKDYDWSHLAARYFPQRVDAKCQQDPSLAVAHGCFWKYHPEKAFEWELRLQDEIDADFTIDEIDSDQCREELIKNKPDRVEEIREKEEKRRERKRKKEQIEDDFIIPIASDYEE